jgi:hypothetical protein
VTPNHIGHSTTGQAGLTRLKGISELMISKSGQVSLLRILEIKEKATFLENTHEAFT